MDMGDEENFGVGESRRLEMSGDSRKRLNASGEGVRG